MGSRIDIGCGSSKKPGFMGIDVDPKLNPDVCWDVTKGIPCQDESVDEVWCSHFYEHLTEEEGQSLRLEILRVCHPGSTVTISVPLNFPDPSHRRILDDWWFKEFDMREIMGASKWFVPLCYKVETVNTTSTLAHERGKPFSYRQAILVLKVAQ